MRCGIGDASCLGLRDTQGLLGRIPIRPSWCGVAGVGEVTRYVGVRLDLAKWFTFHHARIISMTGQVIEMMIASSLRPKLSSACRFSPS